MLKASLVALFVVAPVVVVACSDGASEHEGVGATGSTESALKKVGTGGTGGDLEIDPPEDAGTKDSGPIITGTLGSCKQVRVEAHRPSRTCWEITALSPKAGGSWRIESMFPAVTDSSVRDHFCAYTWIPNRAIACEAALQALDLSDYSPGQQAYAPGFSNFLDAWTIRAECPGAASCTSGSTTAVERPASEIEPPFRLSHCDDAGHCTHPTGGGCDTCGVVFDDQAFLINPGSSAGEKITFNVSAGGVIHQFDVVPPATRVFSMPLPAADGVSYDNGPIGETW